MENASKALLIAAAVLIVILIIALGMGVFNSTKDVSSQSDKVAGAISNKAENAATRLENMLKVEESEDDNDGEDGGTNP